MTWEIDIENVAGIRRGSATLDPGRNVVRASNWKGKSSFVESIATGLGVSKPLTEGEDEGWVDLETPEREAHVELVRRNGGVHRRGRPYLEDEYDVTRAELFACLGEGNEVRRTVRAGENLEDVLLRPLDVQRIEEQIAERKGERERVASELEQAREARKRVPALREKVSRLEDEIADLREKREELVGGDGSPDSSGTTRDELATARSERDRAENQVRRLEGTIERTEATLEEKREELEELDVEDVGDVEAELERSREQLREVKRDVEILESIYSAHELALDEDRLDLLTDVQREISGDRLVCWTCGNEAPREDLEARLEELGERIASLRARRKTRRDEVEQLETEREERRQARRRKRDLESEIAELEEKLADHRRSLADAREQHEAALERVAELDDAVDETVEEIADVESDIRYREAELTEARDELDALENRAGQIEMLEERHEEIEDEIERLRNRRDRITYETREAFQEAMVEVLDRFDAGFEAARLTGNFELVVAREGAEASLDALSEGELELLGFVAALAGYEAFDVADVVPIILVDGVGALADDNLRTLIDYLEDRAEYLVVTAHPEHESLEGNEISPADWKLATNREPAD